MTQIARQIVRYAAFALLSVIAVPALAADVVYPPGLRVGLVPLAGLQKAQAFVGFESNDNGVKMLMTELPSAAYSEVENALKTDAPAAVGPNGVKPEPIETAAGKGFFTVETAKVGADDVRRYSMIVPGDSFSGYVAIQVAASAGATFSDDAVRKMLATTAVRKDVPIEEQLGMLPFKVTELSDFKSVRTLAPGAAVLIGDASGDTNIETAPFMILGSIAASVEKPEDRGRFAQQAAAQIPGLRDARITSSEPMRIDGSPGYETRVEATSGTTPVTVVQWLRFGSGSAALRIIASAPRDQWPTAFTRFRAVRDGIEPR
jgi:hypothetical protein